MTRAKIIEYREQRGVSRPQWNGVEDDCCFMHCLHMARCGFLEHAPNWALNGKAEAVGMRSYDRTQVDTVASIIWDQFEYSPPHREIVLMPSIAYGVYTYNHTVYLTIRGW